MSESFDLIDEPEQQPDAPEMPEPSYLEGLNATQRAAVETVDGPLLVLAGAGTGKTRVLTTRLAHILLSGRARPGEILAVTFTNKAAHEMRERAATLLGMPVEGWWVGTFHALGARLLRRHAEAVGLQPNFTILDTDDQVRLLKQVMEARNVDVKQWPPRNILNVIQRWKDRGLTPDKVSTAEGGEIAGGEALALYGDYQKRLTALSAADFGDLLLHCLTLFQSEPELLRHYQHRFRYILVDEYQDTNVAQYLWLRLLAHAHRNICCVGDDDQSIYSWRGAEVGNILRFESDFPGAQVVRLERNYRSTPHILAAASGLIAHNEGRLGKTLWTELGQGDPVEVHGLWDGEAEARYVTERIASFLAQRHRLGQMAILVRAGFQTREFEERLMTVGMAYRVLGGPRFYERQEIRDALAYLRVIVQPDDDLAFERIVNLPKRGIGPAVMQPLHQFARGQGVSLTASAARLVETDELRPKPRKALAGLLADFERWRSLVPVMNHGRLADTVLQETGYIAMWREKTDPDAPGRVENLGELVGAMSEFESLTEFLEHVSLVMENDEAVGHDKVTLMTLHGAKGLEFDIVFLPGWEEGMFPHQRAMDDGGQSGLEEERRLAYVGLTRARRRAVVTYAANRRVYGQWRASLPSRFVTELPNDVVRRTAERGLNAGANRSKGASLHWTLRQGIRRDDVDDIPFELDGADDAFPPRYQAGQRVFHGKFGPGVVVAADGEKLEVAFDKAGIKRVMANFIREA